MCGAILHGVLKWYCAAKWMCVCVGLVMVYVGFRHCVYMVFAAVTTQPGEHGFRSRCTIQLLAHDQPLLVELNGDLIHRNNTRPNTCHR